MNQSEISKAMAVIGSLGGKATWRGVSKEERSKRMTKVARSKKSLSTAVSKTNEAV